MTQKNKINLTESQLHNIIRECVQSAIYEGNLNEGPMDFMRGMGNFFGRKSKQGFDNTKERTSNLVNNVRNKAQDLQNRMTQSYNTGKERVNNAIQNTSRNIQQFGQQAVQSGRNASAAADTQKLVSQLEALYNKYRNSLNSRQRSSLRSAKSVLNGLITSFNNGDLNA